MSWEGVDIYGTRSFVRRRLAIRRSHLPVCSRALDDEGPVCSLVSANRVAHCPCGVATSVSSLSGGSSLSHETTHGVTELTEDPLAEDRAHGKRAAVTDFAKNRLPETAYRRVGVAGRK